MTMGFFGRKTVALAAIVGVAGMVAGIGGRASEPVQAAQQAPVVERPVVLAQTQPGGVRTCTGGFEVTIRGDESGSRTISSAEGVSTRTVLGQLTIQMEDSGNFRGTLDRIDLPTGVPAFITTANAPMPVSGTATGQSVAMVVDAGNGYYVFGVGTALTSFQGCNGQLNGIMAGPGRTNRSGERVDWLAGPTGQVCVKYDGGEVCI
ncbi:MAG: hypothetical protein U0531_11745 [Dehalococcoidia bacterium]